MGQRQRLSSPLFLVAPLMVLVVPFLGPARQSAFFVLSTGLCEGVLSVRLCCGISTRRSGSVLLSLSGTQVERIPPKQVEARSSQLSRVGQVCNMIIISCFACVARLFGVHIARTPYPSNPGCPIRLFLLASIVPPQVSKRVRF